MACYRLLWQRICQKPQPSITQAAAMCLPGLLGSGHVQQQLGQAQQQQQHLRGLSMSSLQQELQQQSSPGHTLSQPQLQQQRQWPSSRALQQHTARLRQFSSSSRSCSNSSNTDATSTTSNGTSEPPVQPDPTFSAAVETMHEPLPASATELQQQRQQHEAEIQALLQDMPPSLMRRPLFWNNLSSKLNTRKPAIKNPKRHQWHTLAEDYDPMAEWQSVSLPPYAPLKAHTKDYRKIYMQTRPQFHRGQYKRLWRKNELIADQRWKQNWELKLAAARKQEALIKRLSERIIRERSWACWQLDKQQQQG